MILNLPRPVPASAFDTMTAPMRRFLLAALVCATPLRAQDDAASLHLRRAEHFVEEGDAGQEIMELRAAQLLLAEKDQRQAEILERLGMAYLSEGDQADAHDAFIGALEAARALGVQNAFVADAYAGIGFCLTADAHYERAGEYLRKSLALGPSPELRPRVERALAKSQERLGFDEARADVGPDFRVDKITFKGNRTDADVLRRQLPFSEGATINARELAAAKGALYRLELFKSVEVSTAPADVGAEVIFTVKDGWYVIPFPVAAFGAGHGRGGLLIEERNFRRRAESADLAVLSGAGGRRAALSAAQEGWSARFSTERRDFTERVYADGAFSATPGPGAPLDENNPTRFGFIADSYGKHTQDVVLSAEGPLGRGLSGEVGFDHGSVRYDAPSPSVPGDDGKKEGNAFAALKYGAPERRTLDLGAILGFGMAGVDERSRPLRRPAFSSSGEARLIQARKWTASSQPYGIGLLRWQTTLAWGGHQAVSLSLAAGHGYSLPPDKALATGRLTALQGVYAREFRGDSAGGASLSYGRRLWSSRLGYLQAGAFIEDARAWFHPLARDKQGAGASLYYRFWRFPLPLGLNYTYSLDDRNSQIAGGVAGRF